MKILNFTPHVVVLQTEESTHNYPSVGIARVKTVDWYERTLNGVECYSSKKQAVEGLPEFKEDVFLIVSGMILDSCPERPDLICPHDLIRDTQGRIMACQSWRVS